MRTILLTAATLALTACGGEPAKPADPVDSMAATPAPAADAMAGMPGMDDTMKAADAADDTNVAETPDGTMFHTDTTKMEKVHLPAGFWIATPADATQIDVVGATDEPMPDGTKHRVYTLQPMTRDVIAKVVFERRDAKGTTGPVVETRTIKFMIH